MKIFEGRGHFFSPRFTFLSDTCGRLYELCCSRSLIELAVFSVEIFTALNKYRSFMSLLGSHLMDNLETTEMDFRKKMELG